MPSARFQAADDSAFAPAPLDESLFGGLRQRARLFERLLADLLGARTTLARALLPAEFLTGPAPPDEGRGLRAYGAELVLCPDRVWRVAADLAPGAGNHPSARLLEAPVLSSFLPGLCRFLLGETLRLASIPSRWLGDPGALADVAASQHRWVINDAWGHGPALRLRDMTVPERIELQDRVNEAPWRFAARLLVPGDPDRVAMVRNECGDWVAASRDPIESNRRPLTAR